MKKPIFIVAIAAIAMMSCTKENATNPTTGETPISLSGVASGIESKAVVNNGDAFTAQVLATTTSGTYTSYVAPNFTQSVPFGASAAATVVTNQHYPINGTTLYFKGFAPASTPVSGVASFAITGQEDIMYTTTEVSGTKTSVVPNMTFDHLLTQVKVKIVAQDAAAIAAWGSVTSIDVLNQYNNFTLNVGTGAFASTGASTNSLSVGSTSSAITATAAAYGNPTMFMPVASLSTTPLKLLVKTTNYPAGQEVSIDNISGATALAQGTAYTLTLTFKVTAITLSGTVTAWTVGSDINTDVN